MMNQIRPWLYTSDFQTTHNAEILRQYNIKAMLQLYRLVEKQGVESFYIPVEDGYPLTKGMLDDGLGFVMTHQKAGHHVLIACGVGVSRSAAFAIATLKTAENISLLDAFWQVRQGNPKAMPDEPLWKSLCKYFNEDVNYWKLWRAVELYK